MSFFDNVQQRKVVNVASVPQRSPFRYPGGKAWLTPFVRYWLSPAVRQHYYLPPIHVNSFIELFAGGASMSLAAAAEGLADHVTMVEIDEDVAAVWQLILNEEGASWLANRILSFDLTYQSVEALLSQENPTLRERAFRTIIRNRVNRGGILAPGAGVLNRGENGRGIKSRWYPETLAKRIQRIAKMSDHITFIQKDGMEILRENANNASAVFFIDPPYTVAGKKAGARLYAYSDIDHEELFRTVGTVRGDFLMTYDDVEEVRSLADRHGFDFFAVPMRNTHNAEATELLIGLNLEWLRTSEFVPYVDASIE